MTENDSVYDFIYDFFARFFFWPGEVTINFAVHRTHRTRCVIFLQNDFLRFLYYDFNIVKFTIFFLCGRPQSASAFNM